MFKQKIIILLISFAVIGVILSFIPPEQQLGGWIRLIILHGMLSVAGLYTIYAAGVLGLLYLILNSQQKESLLVGQWSREIGKTAIIVWIIGALLSLISMQVAWGGLMWEPRTVSVFTISIIGLGKEYLARSAGGSNLVFAKYNISLAAAVLIIRQLLVYVMHPENPIARSDSSIIRYLPPLLLAVILATMILYSYFNIKMFTAKSIHK